MKHVASPIQPDTAIGQLRKQPTGLTPHITIHTFYETPSVADAARLAVADRRLSRADANASSGGIRAATSFCKANPSPDVLILESHAEHSVLLSELTDLSLVCDEKTRVVVIGRSNDIALYRELVSNGISDYQVGPVDALDIIGAVLRLYPEEKPIRVGKVYAFIGVKGGVGSSVLAQNLAWALSQRAAATMLADLDLQFGTAALNYNINCFTGFADQLKGSDRLDGALLERLLFSHGQHLSVLPCATGAHISSDPDLAIMEQMLDLAPSIFPYVLLDLPNAWSPLVRSGLRKADEVILVAEPDVANLRNARSLLDYMQQERPNDAPPRLLLNKVGTPKRNEIKPDKFASALNTDLWASVGFDAALFGKAAAHGQMIAETSKTAATAQLLAQLAAQLAGVKAEPPRKGLSRFWQR